MNLTYWFRKFGKQYKLSKAIWKAISSIGIRKTKHIIAQACYSINSLIVKKLIAFSPEIEGYRSMARHTAWAFRLLFEEYTASLQIESGVIIEPTVGFYNDMKLFSNFIKSSFHSEKRENRLEWMSFKPTTKAFGAFFGSELRRLKSYVEEEMSARGSDYSLSLAYMFRSVTLSQTRGMGYLPEAIAECRRTAFRSTVNREPPVLPAEKTKLLYKSVHHRLTKAGIPLYLLSNVERSDTWLEKAENLFGEIFSRIEIPLKGTASVDTFVKDGGKIEDARRLLNLFIENGWKIPIRDLNTNEIKHWMTVTRETDSDTDYSRPLFWISYQLFLNYFSKKDKYWKDDYVPFLFPSGIEYAPNIMDTKIIHISEPGKERNLTKSHACLAWFLTPASKITQGALALLPEHKAGLLESGHEWRHQKRVSALSDESGFIYEPTTGFTRSNIFHFFKDWTESTDFITKSVGWALLKGLFDFLAFPSKYGRLVLQAVLEPQPVVETIHRTILDDGGDSIEPIKWNGFIRDGFMMGNPMTKTILHLAHIPGRECAELFLSRRGIRFEAGFKPAVFPNPARLDRSISEQDRDFIASAYRPSHLHETHYRSRTAPRRWS